MIFFASSHCVPSNGFLPVRELVEHDAGGKDVGAPVDLLSLDLLRRHVGRRADDGADLGRLGLVALGLVHARHAEIGELGVALGVDHDVGRLDVAMDDARLVREFERIQQLGHQAENRAEVVPLVGVEVVLELLALDVLHHDVREIALGSEVVHLHDVAVVEPRDGAHFTLEAHGNHARGFLIELAGEDGLDRHPAAQVRVEAVVHQTHRPLAENALDLVTAE